MHIYINKPNYVYFKWYRNLEIWNYSVKDDTWNTAETDT